MGPILIDFWSLAEAQNGAKTGPGARISYFHSTFFRFLLRFLRSVVFWEGPGPILEAPGTLPDRISVRFSEFFRRVPTGSSQGLSGSAGMLPAYTVGLQCVFSWFTLGHGDLAQRLK